MILARTHSEFDTAEAAITASASTLEENPNEAAQTVGVLASKLVTEVMQDATSGKLKLVDAFTEGSLTGDPNANYFVKLHMKAALAMARDNAEAKRISSDNLTVSLHNLAAQPDVAARSAIALAVRLAMIESAVMIATLRAGDS